jgi:predicted transcriptional regulator
MRRPRIRHQCLLEADLSDRLEAAARHPSATKSAIIADALKAWFERKGQHELDTRFGPRLDRLSRGQAQIRRDLDVVLESLALFVRYQLTQTAHLPEPDAAARAQGQDRFQRFVDQVGRRLAKGEGTLRRADPDTEAPS